MHGGRARSVRDRGNRSRHSGIEEPWPAGAAEQGEEVGRRRRWKSC